MGWILEAECNVKEATPSGKVREEREQQGEGQAPNSLGAQTQLRLRAEGCWTHGPGREALRPSQRRRLGSEQREEAERRNIWEIIPTEFGAVVEQDEEEAPSFSVGQISEWEDGLGTTTQ